MTDESFIDFPRLYGAPLSAPEQVQPLLCEPDLHWKAGRSAYETAYSWVKAGAKPGGGIPAPVRAVIRGAPEWVDASLVVGLFEHATALDTQLGPSNTDLLAVCGLADGLGVMAVEGKAGEPFGDVISVWNTSEGKARRLSWACRLFGVAESSCSNMRWQLFHRTASAVLEAKRFRARHAIMLVHDFSGVDSRLADYLAFANAIGIADAGASTVSSARIVDGISLRLAWVSDRVRAS